MARSPIDRLRTICIALPEAYEKTSHGEPTFRVRKKMFAMFADAGNHHGGGRHAAWCKATRAVRGCNVVVRLWLQRLQSVTSPEATKERCWCLDLAHPRQRRCQRVPRAIHPRPTRHRPTRSPDIARLA